MKKNPESFDELLRFKINPEEKGSQSSWSDEEMVLLVELLKMYGKDYDLLEKHFKTKNKQQLHHKCSEIRKDLRADD